MAAGSGSLGDIMVTKGAGGTTAIASKSKGSKVVDRIVVEVLDDGGMTVECNYKRKNDKPGPGPEYSYDRPKKQAFTDKTEALDAIASHLGMEAQSGDGPGADDGAENADTSGGDGADAGGE